MKPSRRRRGLLSAIAVLPLVAVAWLGVAPAAADPAPAPAPADAAPAERPATSYSADPLPTAQINGVVWDQLVVGDVVYATGQFTQARPAGAAAGQQETPRSNILAYTLSTGELIEGFAPVLNGPGRSLALSDDGRTLYVAGGFNQVDGKWHNNLAAFDLSKGGALIDSFKPVFNTTVSTIDVVGSTVYAGGYFKSVNGQPRLGLAAVDAATGATLDWTASISGINAQVYGLRVSPDGTKVVVGGSFQAINGSSDPGYGLALLDATTAQLLPTPVNSLIRNAGRRGAIYDVAVDDNGFYGTGYSMSVREANIEGAFKADWNGQLVWLEPCHGDTYSVYPTASEVYVTNHAHSCQTIGGFADTRLPSGFLDYKAGLALTNSPDVTIGTQGTDGYYDWSGYKSPDILDWYPNLGLGTFTGQYQAAWDVTATQDYLLLAGEFISADGKPQQGLVRYPRRGATATHVPEGTGADLGATIKADGPGTVTASFNPTWDRDDSTLTYSLYRDDETKPAASTAVSDRYWSRSPHTVQDTKAPGGEHSYRLVVSDAGGNTISTDPVTLTVEPGPDAPAAVQASDAFDRTVQNGWGSADKGGAWTTTDGAPVSVADGAGIVPLDHVGWTTAATLKDFSAPQAQVSTTFTLSETPSERGVYTTVIPRRTDSGYYGVKVVADKSGVTAFLIAVDGKTETNLASTRLPDSWSAGTPIHVVVSATGSGTTSLSATVWTGDGAAPQTPTVTAEDSTASLQGNGSVGLQSYLSTSSTSVTGQLRVDEFSATSNPAK